MIARTRGINGAGYITSYNTLKLGMTIRELNNNTRWTLSTISVRADRESESASLHSIEWSRVKRRKVRLWDSVVVVAKWLSNKILVTALKHHQVYYLEWRVAPDLGLSPLCVGSALHVSCENCSSNVFATVSF